jgi:DNA-binding Lrp family transcriptional regulator
LLLLAGIKQKYIDCYIFDGRAIGMPEALVCINTNLNSAEEVFQELKACPEVQEAFRVHGVYDIVARVKGQNFEDLVNIVNRRIKRLNQVQTILSMLIVESDKSLKNGTILLV